MPVTFTTAVDTTRSTTSHSSTLKSSTISIVNLIEAVSSQTKASTSNSIRTVDLFEEVNSYSTPISAAATRQVNLLGLVTSHSNPGSSSSIGVIDVGYDVTSQFNELKNWDTTHGNFVTDRVWDGNNSFYSSADNTDKQASWTAFKGGEQPSEFTYYYQETNSSYGGGIRLVNSNGNYEGGTATDNDEYEVDFANTTGHQLNPGHDYNIWVRVHWDFDWTNDEVTITFEQPDGSHSYTETYTLKQGVDIETVELWNYHSGTWGGGNLNMWWDGLQFIESDGSITDILTGAANSNASRLVDLVAAVGSHSSSVGSDVLRVVDLLEAVTSSSSPLDADAQRIVDLLVGADSHTNASDASNEILLDLLAATLSVSKSAEFTTTRDGINYEGRDSDSFSTIGNSDSLRVVDLLEGVESHTAISAAAADRGSINYGDRNSGSFSALLGSNSIRVIDLLESVESYSRPTSTFVYNDRTSLELIDHEVNWNDDKSFWYTNWFQESRLMESEDTLAIRSLVVPDSKEPAAIASLQYDKNGNGSVDDESDPIELGRDQEVQEVTGIPIDEDGYYRIKIMEYSGYNSLYAIDTAIVN